MTQKNDLQQFGGEWTAEKLERVQKYLAAYVKVMKNQSYFQTFYVDAFAGTGYNTPKTRTELPNADFSDLIAPDTQRFLEGSATKALQIDPPFNKYVFVEKDPARFLELQKLKTRFSNLEAAIELVNEDANQYIQRFCAKMSRNDRAVLFLDPFGMQIPWQTIKAIAATEKIDMWYLFPLGMGVNRMLKRDGNINEAWRQKLNGIFGTSDWYEAFYRPDPQLNMFGDEGVVKDATADVIKQYVVKRLETTFAGVAKNALILKNSKGSPLYLLCFAVGNKNGKSIALKIANYILKG